MHPVQYLFKFISSLLLVFILFNGYKVLSSKNWPIAVGTITDISVSIASSGTARQLKYQYRVDGDLYTNDKEYFGLLVSSRGETTAGYSEGSTVNVFYNPDNPAESVLKPGELKGVILPAVIAFLLYIFYLYGKWYYANHSRIKHES